MKRQLVILLVIGLVAGLISPTTATAKKKKKKKKPVPVDVTYHINWGDDVCILSVTPVESEEACADVFAGATSSALGTAFEMAAVDGLPLTLDAAKPIQGVINVQSFYFAGIGPDVMGIGQPQLEVKLAGVSGGEEVVIGELTTDAYTVTPASADYVVEFEIVPPEELAKTVLDELTLTLQVTGNSMFHGVFPANGTSTLTMGGFALP
jgi:hypothetical protein